VGLVLSVLLLAIMRVLAYWKQRTGRELGSRALVADSVETWVCSYLSLSLLAGSACTSCPAGGGPTRPAS
jgi:divalent metal cation (Fe/Co/Zn/Cd) transporter